MPTRAPIHRPTGMLMKPAPGLHDHGGVTTTQRGYGADWRKVRNMKLRQDPLCEDCHASRRVTEATEVHHIEAVKRRPDLRLALPNLVSLCTPCHQSRTGRGNA